MLLNNAYKCWRIMCNVSAQFRHFLHTILVICQFELSIHLLLCRMSIAMWWLVFLCFFFFSLSLHNSFGSHWISFFFVAVAVRMWTPSTPLAYLWWNNKPCIYLIRVLTCAFGDFRFEQLKKECHFRNVIIPMLFATQTKEDEGERAIRIEKRLNV